MPIPDAGDYSLPPAKRNPRGRQAPRANAMLTAMARVRIPLLITFLGLPGVLLAPLWPLGGLGAGEDDVLQYYPARQWLHDTVRAGRPPWWNPWTGLGRPFLADPQTAVAYPPTWLFIALPPTVAYAACLWLHYSLAVWGTYRLCRALGLARLAALFGGVAFAFCGFMLAHRAHFTMLCAAAWTPCVFWRFLRYAALPASDPVGVRRLIAAAVSLALQCLAGHIQVAALTGLGVLVVLIASPMRAAAPDRAGRLLRAALAALCAAGLFAVQWLPTVAYLRVCDRSGRTYRDLVENSWHPLSLVTLITPMIPGQRVPNFFSEPYWGPSHQVEQFAYAGWLPLLLALLMATRRPFAQSYADSVLVRPDDPTAPPAPAPPALHVIAQPTTPRRPWIALAVFAVLLALGEWGPVCPLLFWLPGANLFRCPARAVLLLHLALAVLAALAVHELSAEPNPLRARLRSAAQAWSRRPLRAVLLLVSAAVGLALASVPFLDADSRAAALRSVRPWTPAVWTPVIVGLISFAALRVFVHRFPDPRRISVPLAALALDLGVIGWTIDVPRSARAPQDLLHPRAPAAWMDRLRETPHRLWTVTGRHGRYPGEYVAPLDKAVANTNILRRIASLTDYGPLQPREYVRWFAFKPWGEAVEAERLLADTRWMRLCNVGWVLLWEPYWPAPADCTLVATLPGGARLYRNPRAAGLAYLADPLAGRVEQIEQAAPHTLRIVSQTNPQRSPDGTLLVVSQLALPGWTATVDGSPAEIVRVADLVQSVRLPADRERVVVELRYTPPGLALGGALSGTTLLVLLAGGLWAHRAARRVTPAPATPRPVPR